MKPIESMSEQELLALVKKRMPFYRKSLNSVKTFVTAFLGQNLHRSKKFMGIAGDMAIDVSTSNGVKSKGRIDIESFKAPKFEVLKRHIEVLNDTSAIDELREIILALQAVGSSASKKHVKQLSEIYTQMSNAFNDSMDILSGIADNHVPQVVVTINEIVKRGLVEVLKSAKEDPKLKVERRLLCNSEPNRCAFSMFYDVEGDGSVFIVVTSLLEQTPIGSHTVEHFINHTNRIYPPLHHEIGSPIHVSDAKKAAAEELSYIDILPALSKHPIAIDRVYITKRMAQIPGVENTNVHDDDVEVLYHNSNEEDILAVYSGTPEVAKLLRKGAKLDYHIHKGEGDDPSIITISVVGR